MKGFLNGIVKADLDQWLGFLFISLLSGLLVVLLIFLTSDHEIRCYYMKSDSMNSLVSYKVMGDVDWGEDVTVFIGHHPSDSTVIMSNLKQCGSK